ncbi:MAG: 23S rRNA (uracil(1939)-C(5))-methyltransferase RlmD [Spirochaetes bacterium]|nr:23S rRNA (uracil(1939)-C(5))-methyltransferase RlmD [Spirochaetota bacterium]
MKKKKRKHFNHLIEKHRGSGSAPVCPHFGECGGCLFQHIAYQDQLALKKEMVNDTLGAAASIDHVHPSLPYRYRSRMDMVTAFGKCGLRRAGSHRIVVDVTGCSIMQEKSDALFRSMRPLVLAVEGYDYLAHQGYLRYVVIREAMHTGQVMVNFVTSARENRLAAVIDHAAGEADSISLIHSGGLADLNYGEIYETVRGGYIEENFDGIRFRITPNSFFQSNSAVALAMYRKIREHARGRVLDLCSGVGSISLFIAGRAEQVTGVEMNSEAVEIAGVNRTINGIANAEFICSDAGSFLRSAGGSWDTIVLDPPRSGMQRRVMEEIDRLRAETLLYMSCNPSTFAIDIAALRNYAVESVDAFDMFPQTPHVELLSVLRRRSG